MLAQLASSRRLATLGGFCLLAQHSNIVGGIKTMSPAPGRRHPIPYFARYLPKTPRARYSNCAHSGRWCSSASTANVSKVSEAALQRCGSDSMLVQAAAHAKASSSTGPLPAGVDLLQDLRVGQHWRTAPSRIAASSQNGCGAVGLFSIKTTFAKTNYRGHHSYPAVTIP